MESEFDVDSTSSESGVTQGEDLVVANSMSLCYAPS